jgi:hypothetical protein
MYRRLSNGTEKNNRYDKVSKALAEITPIKNISVVNTEGNKILVTREWQGRMIYPEQLLAVDNMWVVDNFFNAIDVHMVSDIKLYTFSLSSLVEVTPDQYKEQGENEFAFICDHAEVDYRYFMRTLKIGPVEIDNEHNSCAFHLKDVAYLYADSLQAQLKNKEI